MSHLYQGLSIKEIVVFLISVMLMSFIVLVKDNKQIILILLMRKHIAVKQIKPKNGIYVYKTEGYFTFDKKYYNIYTKYYSQEHISTNNIKVYGKIYGSKNECILAFKNGTIVLAIFDLTCVYNALLDAFIITIRQVLLYSLGVLIICKILLLQL